MQVMEPQTPATPSIEATITELAQSPPENLVAALKARGHTSEELEAYGQGPRSAEQMEGLRQLMLRAASSRCPDDAPLASQLQSLLDPRERAWHRILRAQEADEVLSAMVVEAVKGGVVVDLGVRGFVPASHASLGHIANLQSLVGRTLDLKVVEVNRRRGM